jgi:hypothetical protein
MKTLHTLLEKIGSLVIRLRHKALSFLPSALPTGVTEFHTWYNSIMTAYGEGLPNNDSTKFAIAAQIMHLGPTEANKPKRYFGLALRAGAAKQVAHAVFSELKEKQTREQAQAKAAESERQLKEVPSITS